MALEPAIVRGFLEEISRAAGHACRDMESPGFLQLIRIHPSDGKTVVSGRFKISDIDGMVNTATSDAQNGHNVYIEPRLVRGGSRGKRGEDDVTTAVFALVADRDGYGRFGEKFFSPTIQVQTSEGSFHDWFCFERAIDHATARELEAAMRAAIGADSNTGNPSQPYRVAGTPNYPNAKKVAAGRVTCGTSFTNSGAVYATEALRSLIGTTATPPPVDESAAFDEAPTGHVDAHVEALVSAIPEPDTDRSNVFTFAAKCAVEAGMTAADFEVLCRANPQGCAQKYIPPECRDRLHKKIAEIWGPHQDQVREKDKLGAKVVDELLSGVKANGAANGSTDRIRREHLKPPVIAAAAELRTKIFEPIKYVVPGYIAEGCTLLAGRPKLGKSWLMLDIAVAVATGGFTLRTLREITESQSVVGASE